MYARRQISWLPIGLGLFLVVAVLNAWIGDDPFITLRSIDNCLHGYGLRWNAGERVQVYTHPLWMLLMLGAFSITHEGLITLLVLQLGLSVFVFIYAARRLAGGLPIVALAIAILLVSSKAFVDYSTSGLENPLCHALFVLFAVPQLALPRWGCRSSLLLVALAHLARPDTSILCAPLFVYLVLREARTVSIRSAAVAVPIAAAPVIAWYGFATFYYGFPLPNTVYAKLPMDGPFLHHNAWLYFRNSLVWDPITLPVIALGIALGLAAPGAAGTSPARRLLAAGTIAYLAYVIRIGGDYMSGRWFALPFLSAALLIFSTVVLPSRILAFTFIGAAAALLGPRAPLLAPFRHPTPMIDASGVWDDRLHYAGRLGWVRHGDHALLRRSEPEVVVVGPIGRYGFAGGPNRHIIDLFALGDAFLARLPADHVAEDWGRGHLTRDIPEGYIASVARGENVIVDPDLAEYYAVLHRVTAGPLFYRGRLTDIWRLNSGSLDPLLRRYGARNGLLRFEPNRAVPGFVSAASERFGDGFFSLEKGDEGRPFRWMTRRGRIALPALAGAHRLAVRAQGIVPIGVTFRSGQTVLARQRLSHEWRTLMLPLPAERDPELAMECDETVTPADDDRALCLAVEWLYLDASGSP